MDSFFLGRTDLTDAIGRSLNVVGYRSRLEPSNDFLEEIHGGGSNKRAFCAIRPFPFLGFDDKDTDQAGQTVSEDRITAAKFGNETGGHQ